ncbi:MAG: tetratricopeptide repeat protein [Planctomycetes bacterium]|nr:tetratricopeptide repeat protein [Planctomycetota bacterium]
MSASNSTSSHSVTSIQTQLDIARLHEHQKKFIQARKMYLSILDDDPRNANAYHRLGVVLTRMGKQDEAIPYYQRAVELNPMSSEILSDFGYALFLNDDFEIAEEALQQALAIDPTHKRSIGNLAMVRGHQGYFKDCLSLFREIVPEAEAYANLAFIHVQRGEGRLAIQRYGEALSINDNLESAAEALVQIAKLQNRVEGHAPGLNNLPARDSYVAAAKNSESFETDTTETQGTSSLLKRESEAPAEPQTPRNTARREPLPPQNGILQQATIAPTCFVDAAAPVPLRPLSCSFRGPSEPRWHVLRPAASNYWVRRPPVRFPDARSAS